MVFELNEDQKIAVEKIQKFLKSDKQYFLLTGGPGYGKTTLLGQIPEIHKGLGITISHMARMELSKNIPDARTYASCIGLSMSFDDFNIVFEENKTFIPSLKKVKLIVWDEISMITQNEIDKVLKHVSKNCKIILVGDKYQLPKIGTLSDQDSDLFNIDGHNLTIPVRQTKDNPIFDIVNKIKICIDKNSPDDIYNFHQSLIIDECGYDFTIYDSAMESYAADLKENKESLCVTFTHRNRKIINENIRSKIFSNPKKYEIGDILISNSNHSLKYRWVNTNYVAFDKPSLLNGQRVKIESIEIKYVKKLYKNWLQLFILSFYHQDLITEIFDILDTGIKCYRIKFEGIKNKFYSVHEDDMSRYTRIKNLLHEISLEKGNIGIVNQWTNNFINCDYGYACTIYSVQGQTIENVYVNMDNVWQTPLSTKRKLQSLYVAFSRPTKKLVIF